jgi:integrase
MAKKLPTPFKFRNGWRAQVTLKNGRRPHADFAAGEHHLALAWIADTLANANTPHQAVLGGPTQATLAQALRYYADHHTLAKDGREQECNRISHYLQGAGMPCVRVAQDESGRLSIEDYSPSQQPIAWQQFNDKRRAKRAKTYQAIHALAKKRCNTITKGCIQSLMTTMTSEGLSDSSIQKEVSLLKVVFNTAATSWSWKGFENPCDGIKLGKSANRFVHLTQAQHDALLQAISECDNPYVWPLIVTAIESTLRLGSLLELEWDQLDLDNRIGMVGSKTDPVRVLISKPLQQMLRYLPRDPSGRVFPMTANAVDMAWDGIREKAGLKKLQFRDLRHLGATMYARRGHSAAELKEILGHKSTRMAEVYVNIVGTHLLERMDELHDRSPTLTVTPPVIDGSAKEALKTKRSQRIVEALKRKVNELTETDEAKVAGTAPESAAAEPV